MLSALQLSIVLHEVAKQVDPDDLMTVVDFAETLGITRKHYYDQLAKPQVAQAVSDGVENATRSKDYFAIVLRQRTLEQLAQIAKDKEVKANDRIRALSEIMKLTEFADSSSYEIPYIHLSDEELYEIAVARKERLNLTDDEYMAFRREIEANAAAVAKQGKASDED